MSRTFGSQYTVRVAGVSLVCHVRGRGPLCVVHPGGPGMHWEYLRMPLVERDHTVIYLQPAGTGNSSDLPGDHRYDLATYVEHLDAVVRELSDGPVFVLGHAHGGFVAQSYALRRPENVAGLILYATAPLANVRTTAAARQNLHRYAAANEHERDVAATVAAFDSPVGCDMPAATRRMRTILPAYFAHYWRREAEFVRLRDTIWCWPRPATEFDEVFDVRGMLSSITVPALVVTGAHDFVAGPEIAAMLYLGIPVADLAVFGNSGHFAHLEEAERFAHVMTEFTSRTRNGVRSTVHHRQPDIASKARSSCW
ncbi:alpha/beta fold hydrolase [Micromonospora sp. NPDC050397]|uniref:alpha/beta fold hydrolase n=1 Tax=Micromonospora sp. NPDC050397 TaxID=3364279 RepID=UPI00384ED636